MLAQRNSDPIEWAINSHNPGHYQISASEMHLIRQILLLTHRKLQDIGHVVRTLRAYQTSEIFDYLANFNRPRSKQLSQNMLTNGTQRNKSAPRSSGHFITDNQGRIIESNNDTNKKSRERTKNHFGAMRQNEDQVRDRLNSNGGLNDRKRNSTLLNKFVKLPTIESPNRFTGDGEEGNSEIDVETLCNFLEFKEVKFNSEDAVFILYDCGVKGNRITFNDFQAFMDCWLWN